MSVVIEFRPRGMGKAPATAPRGPAEIIIFNGVRVERLQVRAERRPPLRKRRNAARRVANSDQA